MLNSLYPPLISKKELISLTHHFYILALSVLSYLLEPLCFPLFDFIINRLSARSLHLNLFLDFLFRELLDLLEFRLEVLGLDGAGSLELGQLLVLFADSV